MILTSQVQQTASQAACFTLNFVFVVKLGVEIPRIYYKQDAWRVDSPQFIGVSPSPLRGEGGAALFIC